MGEGRGAPRAEGAGAEEWRGEGRGAPREEGAGGEGWRGGTRPRGGPASGDQSGQLENPRRRKQWGRYKGARRRLEVPRGAERSGGALRGRGPRWEESGK
jgi:hypothetical protein